MLWVMITNLGDSGLMLPAVAIIFVWLLDARAAARGLVWLVLCGVAIALVAITKIAFLGWGIGIAALDFTGISGHSTLSMMVLTAAALLISTGWRRTPRAIAILGGVSLALAIAWSRVHLGFHSWSEAVAGVLLGSVVAACFALTLRAGPKLRPRHRALLVLALMLPFLVLYGRRAPGEALLTTIALKLSGHPCPYSRLSPHALICAEGSRLTERGVRFEAPPARQPCGVFALMLESEGNRFVLSSRA